MFPLRPQSLTALHTASDSSASGTSLGHSLENSPLGATRYTAGVVGWVWEPWAWLGADASVLLPGQAGCTADGLQCAEERPLLAGAGGIQREREAPVPDSPKELT